jgi:bifunctional ADP-heptose synthase (sugar kinase/adenylyltransferase)
MLSDEGIEQILNRLPSVSIGVLGDLFLDRYLDVDAALTEPSLETGLPAYQVVRVRAYPGAAGTVINNLTALGVGRILPIAVIGDDGEGYELRQALAQFPAVDASSITIDLSRRTPTYVKPLLHHAALPPRELNRLDVKNRTPTGGRLQDQMLQALNQIWPHVDALLVMDQVSEPDCGVVTESVRNHLRVLGDLCPEKLILADSRERIHLFRSVSVKINERECRAALCAWGILTRVSSPGLSPVQLMTVRDLVQEVAQRVGRAVFCTLGELGTYLAQGDPTGWQVESIRGYPVTGEVDTVGAGDSTSAGIACAVAAGATLEQAAAFGNLVASITVQQIGTTGTASPEQVRQRWREVRDQP